MEEKRFEEVWNSLNALERNEVINVFSFVDGYEIEDLTDSETYDMIDTLFNTEIRYFTKSELRSILEVSTDDEVMNWLKDKNYALTRDGYLVDFRDEQ